MDIPIIHNTPGEGVYPVNMFWMPELEDGRSGLMGTPGLKLFHVIDSSRGEIRGAWDMNGYLYVVCKGSVYRYKDGSSTTCTGSLLTTSGWVQMVDNGTQVMIIDGTYGYYVTGTTVTQITDEDFPTPQTSLSYQDGYGIVTKGGTGRFYISGLNDFSTWDALDFANAEGEPDYAIAGISDHREFWVFGERSIEPFYNSGNSDFPLERVGGAYLTKGIGAARSVCAADNTLFWLSNERQILRAQGLGATPEVVSTPQLHTRFTAFTTVSDAFAFAFDILGGSWYVITFPSENETWALNIPARRWHRWAGFSSGTDIRHPANCYVFHAGKHIVGHWQDGHLYEIDPKTYTNGGAMFRSIFTLPTIEKGGRWIYHDRLELEFKAGVGLMTGQGSDPMAMIQWSDDSMRTWSNELWRSMGKIGEYGEPCVINRLGRSKARNYRGMITDPVERVLYNPANLEIEVGGF